MRFSIIVAMDRERAIGKDGALPWHIPADLKNFKKLTMGKPIIMGRKTHESIRQILPGRENIILTKDEHYRAEGCTVLYCLDELFEYCKDVEEAMIIGGSEIYKQTLENVSRLYLTEVHTTVKGDTFFPEFDRTEWQEVFSEDFKGDPKGELAYRFVILNRK